jgi:hypothetical membrane protein
MEARVRCRYDQRRFVGVVTDGVRAALLGGVAAPAVFTSVVTIVAALTPEYTHVGSFVSQLGAVGSPYAALMNYAGFVPTGAMLGGFGVALGSTLPLDRCRRIISLLVAVFGAGLAACGVARCDAGCPYEGGSTMNAIHNAVAITAFVSAIVAAGMVGVRYRRLPAWQAVARYSVATSVLASVCLLVIGSLLESRQLIGVWQRLLLASLFLWCAVIAMRVYTDVRRPGTR